MGISVNGPSGIDTASLIEQLVELEYTNKVDPVEEKKAAYEVSINAYSELKSLISSLSTKAAAVDEIGDFNLFTTTSSDEDIATISGSTGCQTGSYSLEVYHTATSEKLVSADNLITNQTASLSSLGISTGAFSINGTEITVDDDDTLQDLRMKINNATDSDGGSIGVSASVLKLSANNYRLVLTSTESGEHGAGYVDVSGSVLQDLGIIVSADGDKGIAAQQLQSDSAFHTALLDLAADSTIRISGKGHDGNDISGQITVSGSVSDEDFLKAVEDIYHGTVTASFESDGTLTITDKIGGNSQLTLAFDTFGGDSSPAIECTVAGQSRKNVLSCGSNAYFSLDGMYMESDSNSIDDVVAGATINIEDTTGDEAVELTIERDAGAIADKIKALADAYNTLYNWVEEQTGYASSDGSDDDDDEEGENGALAGDMTVDSIMNKISSVFRSQFTSVSGNYRNLYSIGISTDYETGEFSLDTDKLKKALTSNFNDVTNLFVTNGSSPESGIVLGRSGADTKSGTYELNKTETGYRIRLTGSEQWYASSSVTGDIVQFSEGPAKGLSLTVPVGTLATGETAAFRYSKGFGDLLEATADQLTEGSSSSKGMIAMRTESLNKRIDYADDRIETLTTQIENYRERLTKQYAAMEQALSTMQTQMTNMLSALGDSDS